MAFNNYHFGDLSHLMLLVACLASLVRKIDIVPRIHVISGIEYTVAVEIAPGRIE